MGCAVEQTAPEKVIKSEPATTPVVSEPEEVIEEPEEVEEEPEEVVLRAPNKKIQELLKKHNGRVTSMTYMYQDQTNHPEEWETWVKDGKMHIKLRELDNVRDEVYIDNIYLDISSKDAKGHCERKVMRCSEPNKPVDVRFEKYNRKTPLDWIKSVTYAEKVAEEQMQMRTVWKIQYEEDGKQIFMWVDEYYGVPAMVRVVDNGAVNNYVFEDISFNSVDDDDLEHQQITVTY